MDSLRGKLILAGPTLKDPNFDRTVVLITEHNEDGAMGLVLNRPAEVIVEQVRAVADDIGVDAVKIGMLGTVETIEAVGRALDLVPDQRRILFQVPGELETQLQILEGDDAETRRGMAG